jgi:hypothetical protein
MSNSTVDLLNAGERGSSKEARNRTPRYHAAPEYRSGVKSLGSLISKIPPVGLGSPHAARHTSRLQGTNIFEVFHWSLPSLTTSSILDHYRSSLITNSFLFKSRQDRDSIRAL